MILERSERGALFLRKAERTENPLFSPLRAWFCAQRRKKPLMAFEELIL